MKVKCRPIPKLAVLLIASLLIVPLSALPGSSHAAGASQSEAVRGLTTPDITRTGPAGEDAPDPAGTYPVRPPAASHARPQLAAAQSDSDWTLVDTDTFNVYLVAGRAMAVRFDAAGDSLEIVAPAESLTALAWQAVEYAPDWLGLELRDAFRRLTPAFQDTFATIILAASDPIVDEVAFNIAHTAPEVLQRFNFYTGVIAENAEDVYAHDAFLPYVDIVDYGSAAAGGDYYSTVRYRTAESGDTEPDYTIQNFWDLSELIERDFDVG